MGAAKNFIEVVNPNKIYVRDVQKESVGHLPGLFGHHIRKWKKDIDQTCQCCPEEEMETAWRL